MILSQILVPCGLASEKLSLIFFFSFVQLLLWRDGKRSVAKTFKNENVSRW